jgi:hypothetical protein
VFTRTPFSLSFSGSGSGLFSLSCSGGLGLLAPFLVVDFCLLSFLLFRFRLILPPCLLGWTGLDFILWSIFGAGAAGWEKVLGTCDPRSSTFFHCSLSLYHITPFFTFLSLPRPQRDIFLCSISSGYALAGLQ